MLLIPRAFLLAAVGATLVSSVSAAFASCQSGWEWANNTLNQNPCEVAGALEASCQGFSVYYIGPISSGTNYVTPQKNSSADICECNTVMYSLYMACTACQNATVQTWTFWEQFCSSVYVSQYPNSIPIGTAIPHWAYLDITKNSDLTFNAISAKVAGDTPEGVPATPSVVSLPSSSTPSPSTISSSERGTSSLLSSLGPPTKSSDLASSGIPGSSGSGVPSSSSSTSAQPKTSTSNTGAIAGGVVGGLVALGIVGGLIAWYLTRRRRDSKWSEAGYQDQPSFTDAQMSQVPLKLYDPADPTTYPPENINTGSLPIHSTARGSDPLSSRAGPGQYTGVPEL